MTKWYRLISVGVALLVLALVTAFAVTPAAHAASPNARFIVAAKSAADFDALRGDVSKAGGKIMKEMREVGSLVVSGPSDLKAQLAGNVHAAAVAKDHITTLIRPTAQDELQNSSQASQKITVNLTNGARQQTISPDPAFSIPGLLWNVERIHAPEAWQITTGIPSVKVGVADTGLDYTHVELASQVAQVVDFTVNEDPPLCKFFFGTSDQDLAALTGGPANGDFNGHGSWIGGNIAAAVNNQGINGIAPNIKLVSLKISQWCGSAFDSTILDAFLYAANNGIDVVSISFGGYLDRSDPDQDFIYNLYVAVVAYARAKGTVIVAAGGNEHVRVGAGGQVLSHGSLTTPGAAVEDLFGLWENPGGIPGVVDVSATGNLVNGASASCPTGTTTGSNATCKPTSDTHQPIGVGLQNQLTYYSNYGPRIDVAAPGGARKFNLPSADRGGTPGFPYTTADGTNVWEAFSITSNFAFEIPCFLINGGGFPAGQCYTAIQGTSMATPHASAVLALIISKHPGTRHNPDVTVKFLKKGAQAIQGNTTPPLSATDTTPGDRTGVACSGGYCHLGGAAISDADAYGAGLVDARSASPSND